MTEYEINNQNELKRSRAQVFDPVVVGHGGQAVKPMGDGVRVISPPMAGPMRLAQTARDLGGRRDRTWLSEAMENKASRRRFEALAVRTHAAAPRAQTGSHERVGADSNVERRGWWSLGGSNP
ncbi:MAG: hypothetical protein KDK29_00835 [Sedimentitalea sp.]|nr:hypothetical protein [Sedimentitalea sp.]